MLQAIVEHGSFAAAAKAVHRVPSAVSYAVRQLEQQLGVDVFDRSGHRATLTPAGQQVLAGAQSVLREARRLEHTVTELRGGWEPDLHVVVDGVLPMAAVGHVLQKFVAEGLPTRVQVHVEYQEGVPARFHRTDADLMAIIDFEAHGRMEGAPLPPLEMVLVAHPEHPLVGAGPVAKEQLRGQVELVVKDSSPDFADQPRASYFESAHAVRFGDFHSKRLAVLAGVGFGWMPLHLVAQDLVQGALAEVPFVDGSRWTYHPHLVARADGSLGRAGRRFRSLWLAELVQKD